MFDYKLVVNKLNEALSLVSEMLSEIQVDDIRTYINVGEWSLALEFLCDVLYEKELPVPSKAYELFQEVGAILELKSETWEKVEPQVTDHSND